MSDLISYHVKQLSDSQSPFSLDGTYDHSLVTSNGISSDLPRHDISVNESKCEIWFYSDWCYRREFWTLWVQTPVRSNKKDY